MQCLQRMCFCVIVCVLGEAAAGAHPDLLLHSTFNGRVDADFAVGNPVATYAVTPEFRPGLSGQALLIGGNVDPRSPEDGDRRSVEQPTEQPGRNAVYEYKGNIDVERGALSFWINPLDWTGATRGMNVLFHTRVGASFFQVYKFHSTEEVRFILGEEGLYTRVQVQSGQWTPGQWHHLAFTWDEAELRAFLDGRLVCARRRRTPLAAIERIQPLSVGPGGNWDKAYTGQSLIDDFRIHARPLSQAEVIALYEMHADKVNRSAGLVTVSRATPTLDGRVNPFEYAFTGTGFSDPGTGILAPRQSRYALAYDDTHLYIAMTSEALAASAGIGDDLIVLHITPDQPDKPFTFTFTPAGLVGEAAQGTNERINVVNHSADGTWVLEAAIPFSALGQDQPPDARDWRFNLVRRYGTGEPRVTAASPAAGAVELAGNLLTLAFRPEAPHIRFADYLDVEAGIDTTDILVRPRREDAHIKLIRSRNTTRGGEGIRTGQSDLFIDGRAIHHQAPRPPRTPWLLNDFAIHDLRIVDQDRSDPTLRTPLVDLSHICQQMIPLQVEYLYTLDRRQLRVCAKRMEDGVLRVRFVRPDDTLAWSVDRPMPAGANYFVTDFELDFTKLAPDEYTVRIDHVSDDGIATEVWEQQYQVPSINAPMLREYVDPEADVVPAPWTAVEVSGTSMSTWGRSYDFADGFLFSSLKSQGRELMTRPAVVRVDGEDLVPRGEPLYALTEQGPVQTKAIKTTDLGRLTTHARLTTHFDGFCDLTIVFSPRRVGDRIDSLSLDIPLQGNCAQLVVDNRISAWSGGKSGTVGDYWHQEMAGSPMLWVGNDEVGFNWLARSLQTWRFKHPARNVELIRNGEEVIVRFNVIDHAVTLDEPITVSFGFTLTPSRPLDHDLMRMRVGRDCEKWVQPWKYFGVPDYDTADRELIRARSADVDEIFVYMGEYAAPFAPEYPFWEQEWRLLLPAPNHQYGERHNDGLHAGIQRRNWSVYTSNCTHSRTFVNYVMHKRAAFFEKAKTPLTPKANNYYFDTGVGAKPCTNTRHGCRPWRDAAGNEYGVIAVHEYRQIVLDTYRMIRRIVPEPKIMSHYGWTRAMPLQHFSQILLGGEGVENMVAAAGYNYYDILTPEHFRAVYSPYIYGMKTVFLNMLVRAATHSPRKFAAFATDPESQRATRHVYGYMVVHDVDFWDSHAGTKAVRESIWRSQDALGWDGGVRFFPYWDAKSPVRQTGDHSDRVLASAYTRNGNVMLAVLNDTDQERRVGLSLDLDALGVEPGLTGRDAFREERSYVLGATWEDRIEPREFRLVVFSPQVR